MPIAPDSHSERAEPRFSAAIDPETEVGWSSHEAPQRGTPAPRRNWIGWFVFLMVLVGAVACYYLLRPNAAQPVASPPPVKAGAPADVAPAIRHPHE